MPAPPSCRATVTAASPTPEAKSRTLWPGATAAAAQSARSIFASDGVLGRSARRAQAALRSAQASRIAALVALSDSGSFPAKPGSRRLFPASQAGKRA